ncbi:MAG: hypothetical protein ACYC5Y_13425 [Symbiobacteriia bacterium]
MPSPPAAPQPPAPARVQEAKPVTYAKGAVTPEIPLVWQTTGQVNDPIEGRIVYWNPAAAQVRIGNDALYSTAIPFDLDGASWDGTTFLAKKQTMINGSMAPGFKFVDPPEPGLPYLSHTAPNGNVWVVTADRSGLVLERRGANPARIDARFPNSLPQGTTAMQPVQLWQSGDTVYVLSQYYRPEAADSRSMVPEIAFARIEGDKVTWTTPAQTTNFLMDVNSAQAAIVGRTVYVGGLATLGALQLDSNRLDIDALGDAIIRPLSREFTEMSFGPGLGAWHDILLLTYPSHGSSTIWAIRDGRVLGSLTVDGSPHVLARNAQGEREIPIGYDLAGLVLPQAGDVK